MHNTLIQFTKYISQEDIDRFVAFTGDNHPLHTDATFAQKHGFKTNIVHGMLASSLFSTVIGKYLPQDRYMYISQTLVFHKPLYSEQTVTVKAEIINSFLKGTLLEIRTEVYNEKQKLAISGIAKAKKLI